MSIRPLKAADLEQVMAIAASLREAPHWPVSAYRSALDPQSVPVRIALVAEDAISGTVAGFAVASVIESQAELETIAVSAQAQRNGIARQLLLSLAHELRASQVEEILLEVRATSRPALALYRSMGFLETGRRPRYYSEPVDDALLMSLCLG